MAGAIIQTDLVRGFAASEAKTGATSRQFYRCEDCLSVSAVDGKRGEVENGWGQISAACGACGGRMEHMGQVGADPRRLVTLGEQTPCDDRCTFATGPKCNCKCGGENHGSKLLVIVTRDAGERPTVTPARDLAKHRMLAGEYRNIRDAARARIEARYGAAMRLKRAGYVDPVTFQQYCDGKRAFETFWAAVGMRSHTGRNKALAQVGAYEEG